MKQQQSIILKGEDFDGLYDRGVSGTSYDPESACPINGWTKADQVRFTPWGLQTRPGYADLTIMATSGTIVQVIPYHTNKADGTVVDGYFVVCHDGGFTVVYDSTAAVPTNPIFTTAPNAESDYVSLICVYGRIIFTLHNYNSGVTLRLVQVYKPGDATSRDLGRGNVDIVGAGTTFVSSATAGSVTVGQHVFGVVGITDTGHISSLIPAEAGVFTISTANKSVDAANLPLGGAEVVDRWILASRLVNGTYTGNPQDYELFFVTKMGDNTTTTKTFDFTDESLTDSADYLWDLSGVLLCSLGMTLYSNRVISWAEANATSSLRVSTGYSTLRISEAGLPESFSESHGLLAIYPDDGSYGVKNCFEYQGLLIIQKDNKTFVTRDNGDDPNTWSVDIIDGTIGGILNGVTRSIDTIGTTRNTFAGIISTSGVYLFDGKMSELPLTWKIERLWQRLSKSSDYKKYQIIDIPTAKLILVLVNDDSGEDDVWYILACDYSKGMNAQSVRWSVWIPSDEMYWIALNTNTELWLLRRNTSSDVFKMIIGTESTEYLLDDGGNIGNGNLTTAELTFTEFEFNRYVGLRLRGMFTGATIDWLDDNGASTSISSSIPAALDGSGDVTQVIFDRANYFPRINIDFTTGDTVFFRLKRLALYGKADSTNMLNP